MGKFLKSKFSDLVGALTIVLASLPLGDVVELVKSGEIISVVGAAIGGVLIGLGKGNDKPEEPPAVPVTPLPVGRTL